MKEKEKEDDRLTEEEYGESFIHDLVMLFQTRQAKYDFMIGLNVVPMKQLPDVPYMILPCQDCNQIMVASNNGKDVKLQAATAFPHAIVIRFGGTERTLMFFIGKCPGCGNRYVVSHVSALKAIAYFAVFGDWPEEG